MRKVWRHTRRFGVMMASLGLVVVGAAVMPAPAGAQGLGDCKNPPPAIDRGALRKQPPAVQQAVAGFGDLILAQGLNVPGVSVAVVIDQDVVFAAGFGCATLPGTGKGKKGVAAAPSTFYRIESVTKVFEAVMMMQQRDRQRGPRSFQVTDPVGALVPEVFFQVGTPGSHTSYSPTYLELASHSSGLPDPIPPGLTTVAEYFQHLEQEIVPSASVGVYSYSDQGFVAMSAAVAIIANRRNPNYHQYVESEILKPLGMHGSTYDPAQIPAPKRATPYVVDSGAYAEYPPGLVSNFPPAGDVWTNVVELSEMVSLQFRTKKGGPGQILACRSIQEMWQPVVPTGGGGSTTIGWFASAGDPVIISKNGGSISWSALVQLVPDLRLGVVAMTNVGAPINKDVPMSELVKIEHAILDTLIPVMASNPPVCKP